MMGCLIGAVFSIELARRLLEGAQCWIASRSRKAYLLAANGKFNRLGGRLMKLQVMLVMEEAATMAKRGHVVIGRLEMYICIRIDVRYY
jgi:hypothetical protein